MDVGLILQYRWPRKHEITKHVMYEAIFFVFSCFVAQGGASQQRRVRC